MSGQESAKLFGRIGIADFFVILFGAGICYNFAMLLTRNPQTIVYLAPGAMLVGAFISRYAMVVINRYINAHFGEGPKRELSVKIAYFICFAILILGFSASQIVFKQHVDGFKRHVDGGSQYALLNTGGAIEETLPKFASELNAKLPVMVDSDTRLDSAMGTGRTFYLNFTLVNYSSSDVTAQEIQNALKQKVEAGACAREETLVLLRKGAIISYVYHGNEGGQITVISVAPSQCGIS